MTPQIYTGRETRFHLSNGKQIAYIPSAGLKEAVNLALLTQRPLLLMGEPGVGKTLLAKAIAHEWYPEGIEGHYFAWHIKSTSKAQEGLYRYDALRRLADVQLLKAGETEQSEKLKNTQLGAEGSYYQYGKLSEAIQKSKEGQRSILLIDEIDKADIDFPNDLLHELDTYTFTIPETGEEVKRPDKFVPPLVIITSNREKELPVAFLRRCIYFYIDFPSDQDLVKLMQAHFVAAETDLQKAVQMFVALRKEIGRRLSASDKNISTSELVDWYMVVDALKTQSGQLDKWLEKVDVWLKKLPDETETKLSEETKTAAQDISFDLLKEVPFYQVLFKNVETVKLFQLVKS